LTKLRKCGLPKRKERRVKVLKRRRLIPLTLPELKRRYSNGNKNTSQIKLGLLSLAAHLSLKKDQKKSLRSFLKEQYISHSLITQPVDLCGRTSF